MSAQAVCLAGFLPGLGFSGGASPDSSSDRSSLMKVSSDRQLVQLTLLVSRLPWTVRMSPAPKRRFRQQLVMSVKHAAIRCSSEDGAINRKT